MQEGDESAFVYNWSPNLGVPTNAIEMLVLACHCDYEVVVMDGFADTLI
ncbi:MAG: hypothetical protein R2788_03500 [Saprospiraceae bacterium]